MTNFLRTQPLFDLLRGEEILLVLQRMESLSSLKAHHAHTIISQRAMKNFRVFLELLEAL